MIEVIDPIVINPTFSHFTNMLTLEDPNPYVTLLKLKKCHSSPGGALYNTNKGVGVMIEIHYSLREDLGLIPRENTS